ncbi:MAG: glycosyltransferase family 87 protein [Acidobacteriota bacterium]
MSSNSFAPRLERFVVAVFVCATTMPMAYVGLRGLSISAWVAGPVALAAAVVFLRPLARALPTKLDGWSRGRAMWSSIWLLGALLATTQSARLSVFMLDPNLPSYSLIPSDRWLVEHSCLTAYTEGARLALEGESNVYVPELYLDRKIGNFTVDAFHYPPPFLFFTLAVRWLGGGDYVSMRALWYAASGLGLIAALMLVAWRLDERVRLRMIATAPALWVAMPIQIALQMSNVQILVVVVSMLAWVALPSSRLLGGILLASTTVAKLFPGILAVLLTVQRRWREQFWAVATAVLITLLTFVVFGWAPFQTFVRYELPKLSSGEAFARPLSRPFAVASNNAPFGIPLKLAELGVPGMSLGVGRAISTIYGLALLALTIRAGRNRDRGGAQEAAVWLSLLSLGQLASPFAPANYVMVGTLWLVCLDRERFSPWSVALIWILLCAPFILPREIEYTIRAAAFLPSQVVCLAVPAWVLWQLGARADASVARA